VGLIVARRSFLLVVDVQAKLVPVIDGGDAVVGACRWLVDVARDVDVPVRYCEEYRRGLGPTVALLAAALKDEERLEKLHFGIASEPACRDALAALGRDQAVLCGMEAHVCLLQSALGLLALGYEVFVVADAVGSRFAASRRAALDRMVAEGVSVVTREMVLFEWVEQAGTEQFRRARRHLDTNS
jgi:nicotinamidase-related amidase